jgi:redox-sensitive bicupin YhaK (pirin superfamily)
LQSGRKAYVHLVRGEVQVNGHALKTGDAAMLDKETQIAISHGVDAEVLVFDLAP